MTPDEYRGVEPLGADDLPDGVVSDGPLVVFKSVPEMFVVERIGNKPNTVRILDRSDDRIGFARECLIMGEPASIEIVQTTDGACFFRRLTDISQVGSLLGKDIWVLSWLHEDGVGTYRDPEERAL